MIHDQTLSFVYMLTEFRHATYGHKSMCVCDNPCVEYGIQ